MSETVSGMALLFPGGGTQYVGMGQELCSNFSVAASVFEHASDLLHYDLLKVCVSKDLEYISEMDISQPAIFTASMAAFRVYEQEIGVVPQFALGHSLGEYSALAAAGVFSFEDALSLVQKRGRYLKEAGSEFNGGMMAVNKVDKDVVENACREIGNVYVSVYNSRLQHVVSGDRKNFSKLSDSLTAQGADVTILNINTPSHSPLMKKVSVEFSRDLEIIARGKPNFSVVSNVSALPYQESDDFSAILTSHMIEPVLWNQSVNYVFNRGVTHLIDIGPQAVLKNLSFFIKDKVNAFAFDVDADTVAIRKIFGRPVFEPIMFLSKCMVMAVSTRSEATDDEEFSNKAIPSYLKLKTIRSAVEAGEVYSNEKLVRESIFLMRDILLTKHVPLDVIENKLHTLVGQTGAQKFFTTDFGRDVRFDVRRQKKIY